ncbi:uncharacterized protein LOC110973841 [Acanthaster planci]|uniref:Uncharacterized protein LOC110973841 n=1 Tax=Acanthaster planci TaxID=133434 RepID=A0A8B7XIQ6_ACAPL|nr:uncharacterized protein LOC110973841 [Acanthaster planci]
MNFLFLFSFSIWILPFQRHLNTTAMNQGTPRGRDPQNPHRGRGCGRLRVTRWGRVVVIASFLTFLLHDGVLGTFGAFIPLLQMEFQEGSGQLGWVVSSGVAVENFSGPMGNIVVKRIGCRRAIMLGGALLACGTAIASFASSVYHLFACLGLVAGLGGSIIHVSIVVAVGEFYNKHYTVANGIAYAGPGAGVFAFPPLIEYLNENYGWRGSLLIEAAIVANVVMMGALFRPAAWFKSRLRIQNDFKDDDAVRRLDDGQLATDQDGKGIGGSGEDKSSDSEISEFSSEIEDSRKISAIQVGNDGGCTSKSSRRTSRRKSILTQTNTPAMLAMFVACVFHTAGYSGVSVHVVNQAVSSGMTTQQASFLLSCVGIGSLVGRLTHGWFLTRKYITPSWMYSLTLVVSLAATITLPLTTTFRGKIPSATAVGFCSGVYFSLVAVILRELVGIRYLGVAFGISLFCSGVGTTLGGYVIGVLKDVTGNYRIPYYLISVFFAVATSFSLPRPVIQSYRARSNRRLGFRPTSHVSCLKRSGQGVIDDTTDPKLQANQPQRGLGCGQRRITRWGRVVVVASFLAFLLHNGVLGTFGIFVPILQEEFEEGSGSLGWAVSSGIAVECFTGPLGNIVVRRIGCRRAVMLGGALVACGTATASFSTSVYHLFVCLGIIAGLGGSIVHVAIVVVIGRYYNRHFSVANGIAYAGPGAGVVVFPPLIQHLNETYDWRQSLIILSAIVSNVMVMGALMRPTSKFKSHFRKTRVVKHNNLNLEVEYEPVETGEGGGEEHVDRRISETSKCEDTFQGNSTSEPATEAFSISKSLSLCGKAVRSRLKRITNAPAILAMFVACVFHTAGYSGVSFHLVNQAVSSGMTTKQASILLTCVGIGSVMGRLTHGWFLTRKHITPFWMYSLSLLASIVTTATFPNTTTFWGKIASATVIGLGSGVYFSLVAVILRELVGIVYLGVAFGISLFCSGLGTTLGGFVVGAVRDATRSTCIPYYLISVFFAIAAMLSLPLPVNQCYRERRSRHPASVPESTAV